MALSLSVEALFFNNVPMGIEFDLVGILTQIGYSCKYKSKKTDQQIVLLQISSISSELNCSVNCVFPMNHLRFFDWKAIFEGEFIVAKSVKLSRFGTSGGGSLVFVAKDLMGIDHLTCASELFDCAFHSEEVHRDLFQFKVNSNKLISYHGIISKLYSIFILDEKVLVLGFHSNQFMEAFSGNSKGIQEGDEVSLYFCHSCRLPFASPSVLVVPCVCSFVHFDSANHRHHHQSEIYNFSGNDDWLWWFLGKVRGLKRIDLLLENVEIWEHLVKITSSKKEASLIFCKWLEIQTNQPNSPSKTYSFDHFWKHDQICTLFQPFDFLANHDSFKLPKTFVNLPFLLGRIDVDCHGNPILLQSTSNHRLL